MAQPHTFHGASLGNNGLIDAHNNLVLTRASPHASGFAADVFDQFDVIVRFRLSVSGDKTRVGEIVTRALN